MKKIHIPSVSLFGALSIGGLALVLSGCASEDRFSEGERTEATFETALKGTVSPLQWWKTAVTLNVTVQAEEAVDVWAMSSRIDGTLYDYALLPASGTAQLTLPQLSSQQVYIVVRAGHKLYEQQLQLSGKAVENIQIDCRPGAASVPAPLADNRSFLSPQSRAEETAGPDRSSLYGNSVLGNSFHYQFTGAQLADWDAMMREMSKESVNARTERGLNCDYELESNGPFEITWVAGNCMSTSAHVLGYYYHSPGTYEDIQYVDISETELYDYIDGKAKVQYQVDEIAAAEYGLEPNRWYDANFDMYDRYDQTPTMAARRDDDAYNAMAVFARYNGDNGNHIVAVRGITFTIDVPAGKRIGFYDRWESHPAPEQYDRLLRQGVRPYTSRDKFCGCSYSAEGLNTDNAGGNFRSFIDPKDHVIWMGMENDYRGGDLDCNDVIFGVTAKLEIYKPSVVEPDLLPKAYYADQLPWTIAYEDVARTPDFDFNDAVVIVEPDYERETCRVRVAAAGSPSRMYLHYDGPEGDQNLGEIHELLGAATGTYVNTKTSVAAVPFREIEVAWPAGYTMNTDAKRFYIEIQRGTCSDCTDVITLAEEPGLMPEAMLIAGKWQWPMEGVSVFSAYTLYPLWGKDCTVINYWGWHGSPNVSGVVSYGRE